ncbi:MAG TPA: LLM class flavin-dependent oxidoreductase [Candidatus Ruania gallistercoris]|uniref:LLM class flavin-dependent oxidoreductase n=1 Tax=Candidatus Ruania gallistercoris TaxID=2838746 RepID=A0A9D2EEY4_9MICO|nr:LLM class flavin-dependent oxidoreductase [Candidatus Ruania gallistercoris]
MTDYGHDLQFGTFLTPQNADPHVPVQLAQLTEAVGLDLVTFQDHPYQPAFLDTWTLISWVAAQTEKVTIAGNVLNLPLRQPAVLARSVASLDRLSSGRVALGLGTGGFWDAIEAMGGPRRAPGEAVEALIEALGIIRGIWDAAERRPLRLAGEHYQVSGAKRGPAPAHDVPIWLGAYKPRMLRLTGREADGWLPSLGYLKDGELARGNAIIDEAAEEAGRHPAQVRRLLNIGGAITEVSGGQLQGPVPQWVDELTAFALEDGIGTFILAGDDPSTIQVFGEEIAPAVREAVVAERRSRGTTAAHTRRGRAALELRRPGIDYEAVPASLAATAVEPGDRGYATVRHNYLRSGSPGLVLLPRSTAEVVEALGYARAQDVPLGVRSGGHGISGRSTNDGGIVLDLRALDEVRLLDAGQRRVRLGAGATWEKVARTLTEHELAISSGDYGGVGVGGLATTGGVGLLGRQYGLTIDHVLAADVVLADGSVVRASAEENPDLLWALRGAGGNFGVVTAVEVAAMPLRRVVFSQMVFDATDTAGLLQRWGELVEASPRELTSFLILSANRGGQGPVAQLMSVLATDDTEAAVPMLEQLAGAGDLLDHRAYLLPYAQVLQAAERQHSGGGDPAVRSTLVEHLDVEVSSAFAQVAASPAAYFLQIRATGGAANDLATDATAYPHRRQNFLLTAMSANQARIDAVWDAEMAAHSDGLYLSFDTDTRPERLPEAFGANLPRLRELKRRYDPENIFRANFPIPPATA